MRTIDEYTEAAHAMIDLWYGREYVRIATERDRDKIAAQMAQAMLQAATDERERWVAAPGDCEWICPMCGFEKYAPLQDGPEAVPSAAAAGRAAR